jgi:hypothetical protein
VPFADLAVKPQIELLPCNTNASEFTLKRHSAQGFPLSALGS